MCERFEYRCLSLYVNQPWWSFPKLSNPTSNLVLSCCLASHSQSKCCSVQLIDTRHNATSVKEQTTYLVVDRSCVTPCGCDVLQRCAICMKLMCDEARNNHRFSLVMLFQTWLPPVSTNMLLFAAVCQRGTCAATFICSVCCVKYDIPANIIHAAAVSRD